MLKKEKFKQEPYKLILKENDKFDYKETTIEVKHSEVYPNMNESKLKLKVPVVTSTSKVN